MADGIQSIAGAGVSWPPPEMRTGRAAGAGDQPLGADAIGAKPPSFGKVLNEFVGQVNESQDVAAAESRKILMGESNNIHQAMLAGEESKLAMTLLVEVRNKLVEGFQEVMRMQV
jgi:flagellar hook-basal body complex protein FliE